MYRDVIDDLEDNSTHNELVPEGRSIVVVIGINKYTHWKKLHNAVNDARGIQNLFVDKFGFEAPIPALFDEAATRNEINELVRDKLPEIVEPNDKLILAFAGHGHTQVSKVGQTEIETGYIIPVNARRNRWSDYIKMNSFLEDVSQIPASHILVLLDACRSGIALGRAMNIFRDEVRYEQELLQRTSRKVITSARRDQRALDAGPIPDHSLFTGTLIEGLLSKQADLDKNNLVTSSELGLYIQQQVGQESDSEQTPDFGSFFLDDRGEMVLSYKMEEIELHHQIGCHLYQLGWILDDKGRFKSALHHFNEAIRLSPVPLPQTYFERGRTHLTLENYQGAIKDFQTAFELDNGLSNAAFYQGIAFGRTGDIQAVINVFESFINHEPENQNAYWVADYIELLQKGPTGKRFALLIGVGDFADSGMRSFGSPENDVGLLKDVFIKKYQLQESDIITLVNSEAKYKDILRAFECLKGRCTPNDSVVIFFSGSGRGGDASNYLAVYDTKISGGLVRTLSVMISAEELHHSIMELPSRSKTLILDVDSNIRFLNLVENSKAYEVMVAATPNTRAFQNKFELDGTPKAFSVFTYLLAKELTSNEQRRVSHEKVMTSVKSQVQVMQMDQSPLLVGNPELTLFGAEEWYLEFFDFAQYRNYSTLTLNEINQTYSMLQIYAPHFPQAYYSFGRAFLAKGDSSSAIKAFKISIEQSGEKCSNAILLLALAQLTDQNKSEALNGLRHFLTSAKGNHNSEMFFHLGRILMALGDIETAQLAFNHAVNTYGNVVNSDALLHLGLVLTRQGNNKKAIELFESYLKKYALYESNTWKSRMVKWCIGKGVSKKFALLIGVGNYANPSLNLTGPPNDVQLLKKALIDKFSFLQENITTLIDSAATQKGIINALKNLRNIVTPEDVVVVFYSGHMTNIPDDEKELGFSDVYLPHDATSPSKSYVITGRELHELIVQIPTNQKYIILDPGGTELIKRAQGENDYTLITSASPGQHVLEGVFDSVAAGVFTFHFVKALRASNPEEATVEEIIGKVNNILRKIEISGKILVKGSLYGEVDEKREGQTPLIIINRNIPLFASRDESLPDTDDNTNLELVRRTEYFSELVFGEMSLDKIANDLLRSVDLKPVLEATQLLQRMIKLRGYNYPEGYLDLGIAYETLGRYDESIAALEKAVVQQVDNYYPEARYYLGRVLLTSNHDISQAVSELRIATEQDPDNVGALYYFGKALRTLAERDILVEAEGAFQEYLDMGAPLGYQEEVEQYLDSRKND